MKICTWIHDHEGQGIWPRSLDKKSIRTRRIYISHFYCEKHLPDEIQFSFHLKWRWSRSDSLIRSLKFVFFLSGPSSRLSGLVHFLHTYSTHKSVSLKPNEELG
jgi:hypothetical protein